MDAERLRQDFPVISRAFPNGPLVYLDSACTSLKPRPVIEAVRSYYEERPVCGGRSVHRLGHEVTHLVDEARESMARFVHVRAADDVVFTPNATAAIHLVAAGISWQKGDVVVTTDKEHNSNWLPWLSLRETRGVQVRTIPSAPDGRFDVAAMERVLDAAGDRLRLVSVVHTSNADGASVPVERVARAAHDRGARMLVDAAQSVPHRPVDVARLGVDYLAVSLHKMMGPSGLGALIGTAESLAALEPAILGGGTVQRSGVNDYELLAAPQRFEAGLQNYAALAAVPAALGYLSALGLDVVEAHERELNAYATRRLSDIGGVSIHGPPAAERGGILPFTIDGLGPHDVALYLDEARNVAVRSGAHCANPYFEARGLDGWVRASFYAYTTRADVDVLVDAVATLARTVRAPARA